MHILAYTYHWELSTIKSLSYRERSMWVSMIINQKKAEGEAVNRAKNKK